MQDLTFGEQVKIILGRKDMTIKELAKKVEARTGKKMSRQNLTQRLGRDNFQERDMRMIAEILGCPFQLNILDERTITESESRTTAQKEGAAVAAVTEDKAAEKVLAEAVTAETAGKEKEQQKESNVRVHERDITIGELVDIHEELDALMQRSTGELKASMELEAESKEEQEETQKTPKDEGERDSEGEKGKTQTDEPEMQKDRKEEAVQEEQKEPAREFSEGEPSGYPKEHIQGELTEKPERYLGGQFKEDMRLQAEEYEGRTQADYLESYGEQTFADYPKGASEEAIEDYPGEQGNGQVQELLQEIESLEKSEKKKPVQEYKPHGWRAYLKQRFKKLSKEQPRIEKEAADTSREQGEGSQGRREAENEAERAYGGGSSEESYSGGEYPNSGYDGGHFSGEFSVETYGEEEPEGGYSARSYVGGYSENEYSEDGYSDGIYEGEYLNVGYPEETYQEEMPQEDEEDKGDMNPYTGKEYESNSVRMHPSRIGYVQVYDRANHEWTDMTEWAFLGYQERKKQLLGKDYDPPIYLD